MISNFKERLPSIMLLVFLLALGALPFLWLPGEFLINSEEQLFMNYEILLSKAAYSWTNFSAYGLPATAANHSLLIPNAIFYNLFRTVGFTMGATQKFFIGTCFFLLGISFWKFASLITNKKHIIFLGIITYLLNFYVATSFVYTGKIFQLILTPTLFYLTYKYLDTKKNYYIALHFVIFYFFQAIFTNLTQLFGLLPIYLVSTIYFCLKNKKNFLNSFKYLLFFLLITAPIYVYHGLIYYFSLYVNLGDIKITTNFAVFYSNLVKVFQMRGVWWESAAGPNGIPYYAWNTFFDNQYIILSSLLPSALIFYLILLKNRPHLVNIFFYIMYCVYLALSTGFSFLPSLYPWLYNNIPFFYIFREPWPKFMPGVIFFFSALVVIALKNGYKSKHYSYIYLLFLTTILLRGYAFFSQEFYFKWKNDIALIPRYWNDYKEWTGVHKDSIIFPIPYFKNRADFKYKWYEKERGNTDAEMPFIFTQSNLVRHYDNDVPSALVNSSIISKNFDFINLAKIDFFLLQNDVVSLSSDQDDSWQKSIFLKYVEAKPYASFGGELSVYKTKKSYQLPKIYITNRYSTIQRWQDLLNTKEKDINNTNHTYFSIYENLNKVKYLPEKNSNKSEVIIPIDFAKINQTKYTVKITNLSKPIILVFQESYNKNWSAYLFANRKYSIPESHHLTANGFLNSWIIQPSILCTYRIDMCKKNKDKSLNIELTLEYTPQKQIMEVYYINLLILLLCTLYLIKDYILIKLKNARTYLEALSK